MSNKQYLGLVVLLVVVGAFVFYWYSYRPSEIKKECANGATIMRQEKCVQGGSFKVIEDGKRLYPDCETFDGYYGKCLKEKGL